MTESTNGLGPRKVTGAPIARPGRGAGVQTYVPEIAKGLAITMKHFFNNTKDMVLGQRNDPVLESVEEGINTISYPE
ncbi:MAG TPA: NADH-quinone oxidoreductase subunit I, partial [Polyangiaceae bacterium]|nr:NADH-quinone oxidoreductase subunit I [Polyangiaceae bacterium]